MDFDGIFLDIDNFEINLEKFLGKGSYGVVYLAKCITNNQQYAAKIITNDKTDQKSLMKESSLLQKLNHPGIIKFYGISFQSLVEKGRYEPTIITEYMPKGSLQSRFSTLSPTKRYICLLGIANAMKYLHEQGIIHRDLKLDNVLLDENYFPKICDFGLSRCFPQSLTLSTDFTASVGIGTPIYMAPELIEEGNNKYGQGVDVYAFAMILYQLVSNKEPYPPKMTFVKLFEKVLHGERPKRVDLINDKMWKLINLCWHQDRNKRPSFKIILDMLLNDFSFFSQPIDNDEIMEYINRVEMNVEINADALKWACEIENVELVRLFISKETVDVNKKYMYDIDKIIN